MKKTAWRGCLSLAIAGFSVPQSALADPATFGSAAILTNRPCTVTTGGDCQLGNRSFTQYAGGAGSAFSTSASNENSSGASGSASVIFANNALPILGVGSFAGATTRTGTSAMAYQTYTYTGNQAINLVLAGTLHFIGSGNLTSIGNNGTEAGGQGYFGANLSILPVSMLASFGTTAQDLVTGPTTFTDCSSGAIASTFSSSLGTASGEHNLPISLGTSCGGGAITLNSGQSFVVLATVQAISNLGGFLDATHTFSVSFDPGNTVYTNTGQAVGADFFATSLAAVPEPATWSMMIGGFGLVGGTLRYRRRKSPVSSTYVPAALRI